MPALVAQMSEQGAIALVELLALALSLDGVGFVNGNRNDTVQVARQGITDEIEGQPSHAVGAAVQGQAETQKRVDKHLLGLLELGPCTEISGLGEVWNGPVELAGPAAVARAVGGNEPVADAVGGVSAEADGHALSIAKLAE